MILSSWFNRLSVRDNRDFFKFQARKFLYYKTRARISQNYTQGDCLQYVTWLHFNRNTLLTVVVRYCTIRWADKLSFHSTHTHTNRRIVLHLAIWLSPHSSHVKCHNKHRSKQQNKCEYNATDTGDTIVCWLHIVHIYVCV